MKSKIKKYTQGPWELRGNAEIEAFPVGVGMANEPIKIGQAKKSYYRGRGSPRIKEFTANANLMAHAPELLEILEIFRDNFPVSPDGQIMQNADRLSYLCERIDSLIKRANGE